MKNISKILMMSAIFINCKIHCLFIKPKQMLAIKNLIHFKSMCSYYKSIKCINDVEAHGLELIQNGYIETGIDFIRLAHNYYNPKDAVTRNNPNYLQAQQLAIKSNHAMAQKVMYDGLLQQAANGVKRIEKEEQEK